MKLFFKIFIVTFVSFHYAWASYVSVDLVQGIVNADLIVRGLIVNVDSDSYVFRVEKNLKGNTSVGDDIDIIKFNDWTCASRREKYEIGQEMIVFLNIIADRDGLYSIIGAGNEGEVRIFEDKVFVNFTFSPGKWESIETVDGKIQGITWNSKDFEETILEVKETLNGNAWNAQWISDDLTMKRILEAIRKRLLKGDTD